MVAEIKRMLSSLNQNTQQGITSATTMENKEDHSLLPFETENQKNEGLQFNPRISSPLRDDKSNYSSEGGFESSSEEEGTDNKRRKDKNSLS